MWLSSRREARERRAQEGDQKAKNCNKMLQRHLGSLLPPCTLCPLLLGDSSSPGNYLLRDTLQKIQKLFEECFISQNKWSWYCAIEKSRISVMRCSHKWTRWQLHGSKILRSIYCTKIQNSAIGTVYGFVTSPKGHEASEMVDELISTIYAVIFVCNK